MITLKILPSFNVEIIQLEEEKVKCSIKHQNVVSVCILAHSPNTSVCSFCAQNRAATCFD